ncbi:xanthine dehydrogenase family protein molybdopterin-binding subunit [Litoreibacter roseus]|uniref:Aldehyde dehydrogenase n=1 Tax=Litoreibacter roseus TaxID=2601869 RepID=A0A6N6JEZ7_9RHOB|nr:molybdopterin cofactor-binding domain-containing protein [Litoreibacter roseus]GFE64806.1 aldehyde dehydrogenase [Litoreibacter roseus]
MAKGSTAAKWTRRTFLASAGLIGGGLALGLTLAPNRLKMSADTVKDADEAILNTWVKVSPENQITVLIPHSEMGQGAGTGLAQMLAEEMEADWNTVSIEQAPALHEYTNSDLGRGYIVGEGAEIPAFIYPLLDFSFLQIASGLVGQMTGGSTAIRLTGHHGMRRAGASAKGMLLAAAARDWDVPLSELEAKDSYVLHAGSNRKESFGSLATAAAEFEPSLKPDLKDPDTYKIVGTSKARLDLPEKVNGRAVFGMDVQVPEMIYAAIALPPIRDARALSVDQSGVRKRDGLGQVLNLGDVVAVTATSFWTATQVLAELNVTWDGGQQDLSSEAIRALHENDLAHKKREVMDSAGNTETSLAQGKRIDATFAVPFLAHATMEPMNCTAHVTHPTCEIWVGHQNPLFAKAAVADVLGYDKDSVTIHSQYLGGGFGRRGDMDFVTIAARIAAQLDKPVKVIWSREADMANDSYRPAILSKMAGSLDGSRISAVSHAYIDASSGMPDSERPFAFPYDVPNRQIERVKCPSPIPVGTWRAVDFTQMGFFNETFMDELAYEADVDPLQFRLDHTTDPRRRAVLQRLGKEARWGADLEPRRSQGVAMVESFGTIVAQVVDASISDDGGVRVNHVTSVVDCGRLINPDAGEAQIKGSVIFGLTSALFGEITLEGGKIVQQNFPDYRMIQMENAPSQTVYFMPSGNPPGGLGEPGVPPVTPALTNAIFAATGTRVRELPIAKHGFYGV